MIALLFAWFRRILPHSTFKRLFLLLSVLCLLVAGIAACSGINPFADPARDAMPAPPPIPPANQVPVAPPPMRAPTLAPSPTPSREPLHAKPSGLPTPSVQDQRVARKSGVQTGFLDFAPDPNATPIYSSFDFLSGYLDNLTTPIIMDGTPWDYGSTNIVQLQKPGGGTSYWDYWSEAEPWNSPNHLFKDSQGKWLTYNTETVTDKTGKAATGYILFEEKGPGVMDKLWFTQDPVQAFLRILTQLNLFLSQDPPEVTQWGNLSKLGNLRIQVDGKIVYDGPVENWFSGDAQNIPAALRPLFVWRYGQFGSDGNIIPITYQNRIKVEVYGGEGKPKWFMATGLRFPAGTRVQSYAGGSQDVPLDTMASLSQNVLKPEDYVSQFKSAQTYNLTISSGSPSTLEAKGAGTVAALQFRISKGYDLRHLWLRVHYGTETGIDLPLLGFFSEPGQISLHHSTPIGLIDVGDAYLLYSNLPMPYQDGITVELDSDSATPIPVQVKLATTNTLTNTLLRVLYQPGEKLQALGPDFTLDVPGNGKVVGLVLQTYNQAYDGVPYEKDPKTGKEDASKKKWPMGYLEGNLTLVDGNGVTRYYSGQEDWAEGGYYFNSGYTTPPGGANRPFSGILRYQEGKDGYATLFRYFNDLSAFRFKNGLHFSFGHGTWDNNFPVTYGAALFYYSEVPGMTAVQLPASEYEGLSAAPRTSNQIP